MASEAPTVETPTFLTAIANIKNVCLVGPEGGASQPGPSIFIHPRDTGATSARQSRNTRRISLKPPPGRMKPGGCRACVALGPQLLSIISFEHTRSYDPSTHLNVTSATLLAWAQCRASPRPGRIAI